MCSISSKLEMIDDARNIMDLIVQQTHNSQLNSNKVPVRKIYIDEDPTKEEAMVCPRCAHRNLRNSVRYLYLSLTVAIFKCEADDCMYPFRNFKFKNLEENTVYHYQQLPHQRPAKHDSPSDLVNDYSKPYSSYDPPIDHTASVDFNMDFLSAGNGNEPVSISAARTNQASSTMMQPVDGSDDSKPFDTRFIDDILEDLFPTFPGSKTSIMGSGDAKQTASMNCEITIPSQDNFVDSHTNTPSLSGRKLEKCLRVFKSSQECEENDVFKKPIAPKNQELVVEHITPTKLRIKKISSSSRNKTQSTQKQSHFRTGGKSMRTKIDVEFNTNPSSTKDIKQASALVERKAIKPLEFVCTLNTLTQQQIAAESSKLLCQTTVEKSPNRIKVQKMLNFIQRSMKNRAETSPSSIAANNKDCRRPVTPTELRPGVYGTASDIVRMSDSNAGKDNKIIQMNPCTVSPSGGMEILLQFLE